MRSAGRAGEASTFPRVSATPFRYVHHLVTVPVLVDGAYEARFVVDTGIGLTVVSRRLFEATAGCEPLGSTFTGRRMSGQELTVPLARVRSLTMGSHTCEGHVVGVLENAGFSPELAAVDGFLSLAFFETAPFTVDHRGGSVVVESAASLARRAEVGVGVPLRLERQGPALDAFVGLAVPGRGRIDVEVDMGSDSLILDEALAGEVGVELEDPSVRRVEGRDETGHRYVRRFTRLPGTIHVAGAPSIRQSEPEVMFQRIIHDGLLGHAFLREFVVTYDVPGERMIFG